MEERYRERGALKLLETVQALIATCGQAAAGTSTTVRRIGMGVFEQPSNTTTVRALKGAEPDAHGHSLTKRAGRVHFFFLAGAILPKPFGLLHASA